MPVGQPEKAQRIVLHFDWNADSADARDVVDIHDVSSEIVQSIIDMTIERADNRRHFTIIYQTTRRGRPLSERLVSADAHPKTCTARFAPD
jgi:hypothetical protein